MNSSNIVVICILNGIFGSRSIVLLQPFSVVSKVSKPLNFLYRYSSISKTLVSISSTRTDCTCMRIHIYSCCMVPSLREWINVLQNGYLNGISFNYSHASGRLHTNTMKSRRTTSLWIVRAPCNDIVWGLRTFELFLKHLEAVFQLSSAVVGMYSILQHIL